MSNLRPISHNNAQALASQSAVLLALLCEHQQLNIQNLLTAGPGVAVRILDQLTALPAPHVTNHDR
jgi:hypothetical protein